MCTLTCDLYLTASTEKITKPRTKQTARKSTGGMRSDPGIIAMLFKY